MSPIKRILAVSTAFMLPAAAAVAQVTVKEPWVRATVTQQTATGAFMQLSSERGARLVEVRSPAAAQAELHEMKMDGDVMRMRPLPALEIGAGKTVDLKPGGYHIMLTGLKSPIKTGDSVPITLVVEDADRKRQTIELAATARPLGNASAAKAAAGQVDHGGHMDHGAQPGQSGHAGAHKAH